MSAQPRIAHCYDPSTRAYMCEVRLQQSSDGTWPLPDYTVEAAPPAVPGTHQALRLADDGSAWELVHDFRNCPLWDTATAQRVANRMTLAEPLPAGVTHLAPPALDGGAPVCITWSADRAAWELASDYSGRPLWNKRDGSIAEPLPRGQALPDTLTDRAPPTERAGEITFDDSTDAWVNTEPTTAAQL